ncbi:MAG: glutaredoxin family protein [Pseudomonadales bacterium]|nr:glutaredoxin family protein [Pseudomonadales bacterium]
MFEATLNPAFFEIEMVDIADSDLLITTYGTRIPVLRRVQLGRELNWPFSPQQLVEFLSE